MPSSQAVLSSHHLSLKSERGEKNFQHQGSKQEESTVCHLGEYSYVN